MLGYLYLLCLASVIPDYKEVPYTGKCFKDNTSSTHNSHFATVQLSGPSAFMLGEV